MNLRRAVFAVALAGVLAGCAPARASGAWSEPPAAVPLRPSASPRPRVATVPVTYPANGGGTFTTARAETGPQPAGGGRLLRYRVEIEREIRGIPAGDFAAFVTATLDDPRSWTAGGKWRLRRVGAAQPADFTIYLVTPGTRDDLCAGARDGYTSCRSADRVVLDVARWVKGVPKYGAPLVAYRQYMVNHEVGHRLGNGHELCPGPGDPAPVMQQQTLGMHGCTPNAWPYPDRRHRYAGRSGVYEDTVPPRDKGQNSHPIGVP
jgi:Protein of unknown function (DUF3152)